MDPNMLENKFPNPKYNLLYNLMSNISFHFLNLLPTQIFSSSVQLGI